MAAMFTQFNFSRVNHVFFKTTPMYNLRSNYIKKHDGFMSRKGEARSVMRTVIMLICDGQMVNITKAWDL